LSSGAGVRGDDVVPQLAWRRRRRESDARDLEQKPEAVISLLEDDQPFGAKQKAHLGRATLSRSTRILMWSLCGYVILVLVIIVVQIMRSLHWGGRGQ
jgi:hypothetical protein